MKVGAYLAVFAAVASAMQVEAEVDTEVEYYLPPQARRGERIKDPYMAKKDREPRKRRERRERIRDTSS